MKTRLRGFNGHPTTLTVGSCPTCGKAGYVSRREAKRAARGMFPGTHHKAVKCGQWWHIQRVWGETR